MSDEAWTVGRLLNWTADYLKQHASDSPRLEAEVLLAQAMGCKRIELYTSFDTAPSEAVRAEFRGLVKQRAEGRPVAYLVGRREFYSLEFRVTPDVLIPRPETELLVVALLDLARGHASRSPAVVDVGTGSGILAVCAAKHLPNSVVTAVDLSDAALAIAKENASRHQVDSRIRFLQSDLLAAVPAGEQFDFVVSNPPYVSLAEYDALPVDVRCHEPRMALVAGERGTEVVERLVAESAERMRPGGWLLIEISPMIHDQVCSLFDNAAWELAPTIKDIARLPRVVQARRKP